MDRFAEITQKTREVLARAENFYGVRISPVIAFNLTGRVAGWASCKINRVTGATTEHRLRFNRELILGQHFEDMRDNTVPHEVAHLVCWVRPDLGRNHNPGWRRVCMQLGGNGAMRHDYDVVVRGRWDYLTDRGHKVSLTRRHHDYVQQGGLLTFKRGLGTVTRACPHAPSGQLRIGAK
jgi:predicted SprT family Zn-dependent metalloprotease